MREVDIDKLNRFVRYEPETGKLYYKHPDYYDFESKRVYKIWVTSNSGKQCFKTPNKRGYLVGSVFGVNLLAHRVAWAIYYGYWPKNDLDHINGDRSDNRIHNLREATRTENNANRSDHKYGVSGYRGVSPVGDSKTWRAYICLKRKQINLGCFKSKEEAALAYNEYAKEIFGEYAILNDLFSNNNNK